MTLNLNGGKGASSTAGAPKSLCLGDVDNCAPSVLQSYIANTTILSPTQFSGSVQKFRILPVIEISVYGILLI